MGSVRQRVAKDVSWRAAQPERLKECVVSCFVKPDIVADCDGDRLSSVPKCHEQGKTDRARVDEGSLRRRRFGSSRAARMGVRSDGDAIRPRTRRTEFEPRLWFNHRGSASGSSYRTAPGCLLGHHGRRPFLDASPHLASSSSYGGPRIPAGGRWNSLRDCVRAPRKHRYGSRSGRCSPAILRAERLHPSIPALVRAEPFGVAHKS